MADLSGMTGFARTEGSSDAWTWIWEVRSVNGKGLDPRFRLPPGWDRLDAKARELVKARFARGNFQCSLTLKRDRDVSDLQIDTQRIDALIAAASPYIERGEVTPPSFDGLLALGGFREGVVDELDPAGAEALEARLLDDLAEALDALLRARRAEGRELAALLHAHVDTIARLTAEAAECDAARLDAVRDRVAARFAELLPEGLPEDRLAIEAAALAVKMDVREELDRLHSHVGAARDLLAAGSPVGRKLDFLSQEFNREANTLCSKSSDSSLTRIGLAIKNAVDQFREQVQNVE